jgi:Spy/CpxP family protein refolding chaperone
MTRNRLLIWAVLILLATNIAIVVSALSYSGRIKAEERTRSEEMADARVMFFRDHLQLTESQQRDFMIMNRSFTQNASRMTSRLDILRRSMVNELARPEPDMKKVEEITTEIGLLHRDLKQETAAYYLDLKKVCTPEQQERLKEMFMVMSDPEGDPDALRRGPMGGGRGRNIRGNGRGMGVNRF